MKYFYFTHSLENVISHAVERLCGGQVSHEGMNQSKVWLDSSLSHMHRYYFLSSLSLPCDLDSAISPFCLTLINTYLFSVQLIKT